ncbi:MAG: hypothetical protein NTV24_04825 [Candidatus Woesebacteria bacterium]|nr:hypothetical protein [Candidatus Woesebacteria bacterium]
MKFNKNKYYTMKLNEVECRIIKRSLEFSIENSEEIGLCEDCEKRSFDLLDRFTKMVEGQK